MPPAKVKGKQAPVPVFRVLGMQRRTQTGH
jgi:hypothetical protein